MAGGSTKSGCSSVWGDNSNTGTKTLSWTAPSSGNGKFCFAIHPSSVLACTCGTIFSFTCVLDDVVVTVTRGGNNKNSAIVQNVALTLPKSVRDITSFACVLVLSLYLTALDCFRLQGHPQTITFQPIQAGLSLDDTTTLTATASSGLQVC